MTVFDIVIRFFLEGGFFMYPVLLIAALGTAVVIERLLVVTRAGADGEAIWQQLHGLLAEGRFDEASRICRAGTKPIFVVLSAGLGAGRRSETREVVQRAMEEAMMGVIPPLERRTPYLPILANVATLMGLLGTIIGVIQAFSAVSAAEPSQKAVLLAHGISVALNMTAFGLIVAIPLILFYAFLQSRTTKIIDALDQYSTKLANFIADRPADSGSDRRQGHAAPGQKTGA